MLLTPVVMTAVQPKPHITLAHRAEVKVEVKGQMKADHLKLKIYLPKRYTYYNKRNWKTINFQLIFFPVYSSVLCEVSQDSSETCLLQPIIKDLSITLQALMEKPTRHSYLSSTDIQNEETLMVTCINSYETPIKCNGEY